MKLVKPAKPTIAGERYGRLTVLELDHAEKSRRYWKCSCSCGGTTVVKRRQFKKRHN